MPANKPYPGEDPRAAAKRIARNKANPSQVATKGEMMGGGYGGAPTGTPTGKPMGRPMTRGKRRKPGYNFSRNLGDTPDIGY